jgi:hypothetical protein
MMSVLFQIFHIFVHVRFAWTNLGTLFVGHKFQILTLHDTSFATVVLTEDLTFLSNKDIHSSTSPRTVKKFNLNSNKVVGILLRSFLLIDDRNYTTCSMSTVKYLDVTVKCEDQ